MRFAFLALMVFCARAEAIPITGTARWIFAGSLSLEINGPGLSFSEGTGVPSQGPVESCPSSPAPCQLTITFPIPPPPSAFFLWTLAYNGIEIQGNPVSANGLINGFLTVSTDAFVYENALITVPVSVSGVLQAFQNGQTDPFADLVIAGTGTAEIVPWPGGPTSGFVGIDATFSGTATPIPEPSGLFLVGLGVVCVIGHRRLCASARMLHGVWKI